MQRVRRSLSFYQQRLIGLYFRLLELIVINLGLQAGILTPLVFSMFVFHALVLTFITTPITALIVPEKHRLRLLVDSASSSQTTLGVVDARVVDALDGEEKAAGKSSARSLDSELPLEKAQEKTQLQDASVKPIHDSNEKK